MCTGAPTRRTHPASSGCSRRSPPGEPAGAAGRGRRADHRRRPRAGGGRPAARALDDLLAAEPLYRTVWELGFGINTDTEIIPANCGPNEVYGAYHGVVNLGLGVTPATRFALAFLMPRSSLLASDGTALLGARKAVRRGRMQRVAGAGCGCH
ncbi:hypothetical protein ACFQ2B_36680 [Streptomyces stramineus]